MESGWSTPLLPVLLTVLLEGSCCFWLACRIATGDLMDTAGDMGRSSVLENMDCIGAWMKSLLMLGMAELMGIMVSPGNMLASEGLGERGSGDPADRTELVNIGLRRGEAPLYPPPSGELGEGLRTGEAEPFGELVPILRIIVEEMVFLAACLALSVLTKLVTSSSRLPLRVGEARSSRGPTSLLGDCCWALPEMCVIEEPPLAGDSRVEEEGEEKEELRGEAEFLPMPPGCCRSRLLNRSEEF